MFQDNIQPEHFSIGDFSLFLKDIATVDICKKQWKEASNKDFKRHDIEEDIIFKTEDIFTAIIVVIVSR